MTVAGADLTDLDNFASGFPHALFAEHRRVAPVCWHEPTEHTPDGEGFWSVATYAETLAVLRDPITFSSQTGGQRPFGGTLLQDLPIAGQVLNMTDDPRHGEIRRLVSSGLTPRMITRVTDDLLSRVRRLMDGIEPGAEFDFLLDVAAELPMQMICILLGVPESDRHWLFEAIEPNFDFGGSRTATMRMSLEEAGSRIYAYGLELIAAKRAHPTDDMLSTVVNATLDDRDGPAMSEMELYLFFNLLFSAGAETTRNAVAGGLLALASHPDQLDLLRSNPSMLPTAVEEILRWTSPSPSKRRTATRDVVLGPATISAGQKVLVWEGSANRDPLVFDDPDRFDITRSPNPHLSFGIAEHFCLGVHLARLEGRVFFQELLAAFPDVALAGDPVRLRSNLNNSFKRVPVDLGPRRG